MKVRVQGLKEIDKALGELPKAVAKRALREIGTIVLEPMANRAASLAPDDTGKLSFSISVSDKRTRRAKTSFNTRTGIQMAMGPATGVGSLNYATFAEFGTIDTPAKPYMRPTWDSMAASALDDIKAIMWSKIRPAAERQARRAAKKAA